MSLLQLQRYELRWSAPRAQLACGQDFTVERELAIEAADAEQVRPGFWGHEIPGPYDPMMIREAANAVASRRNARFDPSERGPGCKAHRLSAHREIPHRCESCGR